MARKNKVMTTILIIIISIFYIIGLILFVILVGMFSKFDASNIKNLPIVLFYPITMWFIK